MIEARQWTRIWMRRALLKEEELSVEDAPPEGAAAIIPPDDPVLGVYHDGPRPEETLVVTEDSIVFHDGQWRRARFAEIASAKIGWTHGELAADRILIEGPDLPRPTRIDWIHRKLAADRILIEGPDLPRCTVMVRSGHGHGRNVYTVARFVARVAAIHRGEW